MLNLFTLIAEWYRGTQSLDRSLHKAKNFFFPHEKKA